MSSTPNWRRGSKTFTAPATRVTRWSSIAPLAAAKGAIELHRVTRVAGAVNVFEPRRQFGVEDIAGLGECRKAVGLDHLRPKISVITGGIAATCEQVLEMRRTVTQPDLLWYPHAIEEFALEPSEVRQVRR